jgi:hypothetical protein
MPPGTFRRIVSFLAVGIGFGAAVMAQTAPLSWVRTGGGIDDDYGWGIATDQQGCFVAGHFSNKALFDQTESQAHGATDGFLARYDSKGTRVWFVQQGGVDIDESHSVALDGNGNVYLAGGFSASAQFGGKTLLSQGKKDVFLAKYRTDSQLVWVRSVGGVGDVLATSVAVDAKGDIVLAGSFSAMVDFSGVALTSAGRVDIFLAKYNPEGGLVWARQAGGTATDQAENVAVDKGGNIYVTGNYSSTNAFFESTVLTNHGQYDIFLAKYDSGGTLLWARGGGGTQTDGGAGLAIDKQSDVYVTGYSTGDAVFDQVVAHGLGQQDIFVAKYSSDGEPKWVKTYGGPSTDEANSIAIDSSGDLYCAGYYVDRATFGNISYNAASHADVVILKLDPEGNVIWSSAAQGTAYSNPKGITVTPNGEVYACGYFRGSTPFGPFGLANRGGRDFFVAKIDPPPKLEILRGAEGAIVRWPVTPWQLHLEASDALGPPKWSGFTPPASQGNGFNLATNRSAAAIRFFRLAN